MSQPNMLGDQFQTIALIAVSKGVVYLGSVHKLAFCAHLLLVPVVCCCLNSDCLSILNCDLLALFLCCCDSAMSPCRAGRGKYPYFF